MTRPFEPGDRVLLIDQRNRTYMLRLEPGTTFRVATPDPAAIDRVALVRLGAATHAFDQDQRFVPLTFTRGAGTLEVEAPRDNAIAPPGHYMLFVLTADGVPSVAKILKVNVASPGGSSDPIGDDPVPPPPPPPGPPPDVDPVFPIDPEPKGGAAAGGGGCSSAGGFAGALAIGLPLLWWRARRRAA